MFVSLTRLKGIKKSAGAGRSEVPDARRAAGLHSLLLISAVKEVDIRGTFKEIQVDTSADPARRNLEKTSIDATRNTKLCKSGGNGASSLVRCSAESDSRRRLIDGYSKIKRAAPGREIWMSTLRLTARGSGEEAAALRSSLLPGRSIPASTHRAAIMSSLAGRTAPFLWVASSRRPPPRPSRWSCLWSLFGLPVEPVYFPRRPHVSSICIKM